MPSASFCRRPPINRPSVCIEFDKVPVGDDGLYAEVINPPLLPDTTAKEFATLPPPPVDSSRAFQGSSKTSMAGPQRSREGSISIEITKADVEKLSTTFGVPETRVREVAIASEGDHELMRAILESEVEVRIASPSQQSVLRFGTKETVRRLLTFLQLSPQWEEEVIVTLNATQGDANVAAERLAGKASLLDGDHDMTRGGLAQARMTEPFSDQPLNALQERDQHLDSGGAPTDTNDPKSTLLKGEYPHRTMQEVRSALVLTDGNLSKAREYLGTKRDGNRALMDQVLGRVAATGGARPLRASRACDESGYHKFNGTTGIRSSFHEGLPRLTPQMTPSGSDTVSTGDGDTFLWDLATISPSLGDRRASSLHHPVAKGAAPLTLSKRQLTASSLPHSPYQNQCGNSVAIVNNLPYALGSGGGGQSGKQLLTPKTRQLYEASFTRPTPRAETGAVPPQTTTAVTPTTGGVQPTPTARAQTVPPRRSSTRGAPSVASAAAAAREALSVQSIEAWEKKPPPRACTASEVGGTASSGGSTERVDSPAPAAQRPPVPPTKRMAPLPPPAGGLAPPPPPPPAGNTALPPPRREAALPTVSGLVPPPVGLPPPPPPGAKGVPPPPPLPPGGKGVPPAPPLPPGGKGVPPAPPLPSGGKGVPLLPPRGGPGRAPPQPCLGKTRTGLQLESATKNVPLEGVSSNTVENSLFNRVPRLQELSKDEQTYLKELYSRRKSKADKHEETKTPTYAILDSTRERNVGIVLQFLRLPIQVIEASIRTFDDLTLGDEHISGLVKIIPTPMDREAIARARKLHGGPFSIAEAVKLSMPVRFFLMTERIDHYDERIRAWHLKLEFQPRVEDLDMKLHRAYTAVQAILTSTTLPEVLTYFLSVSNFLNEGSRFQDAKAFPVTQLPQIMNFRTTDGKGVLLEYIVKTIARKRPDLLGISEELLPAVEPAREIDVPGVEQELSKFRSRLQRCGPLVCAIPDDKRWSTVLGKFIYRALPLLERTERLARELDAKISLLPDFCCEKKDSFSVNEVFRVICTFCKRWDAERVRQVECQNRQRRATASETQSEPENGNAPENARPSTETPVILQPNRKPIITSRSFSHNNTAVPALQQIHLSASRPTLSDIDTKTATLTAGPAMPVRVRPAVLRPIDEPRSLSSAMEVVDSATPSRYGRRFSLPSRDGEEARKMARG